MYQASKPEPYRHTLPCIADQVYGHFSEECHGTFRAKRRSARLCPPCKKMGIRITNRKFVTARRKEGYTFEAFWDKYIGDWEPEYESFWIDRVCSNCGRPGVPTAFRFLCIPCHKGEDYVEYPVHLERR